MLIGRSTATIANAKELVFMSMKQSLVSEFPLFVSDNIDLTKQNQLPEYSLFFSKESMTEH